MKEVQLSAGTIEYTDTGGDGPVIVFVHGLVMDGSVWRKVVAELAPRYRCILPTLPLGAHRYPMHPDADLSLAGIAALLGEFIEQLDLHDITLAFNDWGGPLVTVAQNDARIGRLAITSCEAFDNIPPGLPGLVVWLAAQVPGGINALLQPLRWRWLRRLPIALGWMSKRPVPHSVTDAWLRPAMEQADVRRDLRKYVRSAGAAKGTLAQATEGLPRFTRPVLIAWAVQDRLMPIEHARILARRLSQSRLLEIEDSYTLIPEDQPAQLARAISELIDGHH